MYIPHHFIPTLSGALTQIKKQLSLKQFFSFIQTMSVNISLDFVEIDGDNDNLSFIILKKFPAISGLISNSQRSIRHYALAFKTTSLCSTPHHTPSIYYNLTPLFSIKTQFNLDTIYKKHNLNQLIFKKTSEFTNHSGWLRFATPRQGVQHHAWREREITQNTSFFFLYSWTVSL
jgi:hypothetical protein